MNLKLFPFSDVSYHNQYIFIQNFSVRKLRICNTFTFTDCILPNHLNAILAT